MISLNKLPEKIETVAQLDEILTTPWDELVDFITQLDGDIMMLGAGGKIGPNITLLAKRAIDAAGVNKKVYAVARRELPDLQAAGVETITCDMMNIDEVQKLPKVKNIIYLVGRKFGSTGAEHLTWATNVIVPCNVAKTFTDSRIVAFSTGCVYPIEELSSGGSTEQTPPNPIGEYAMSCLGRERMFDYYSHEMGEKVVQLRLNYAVELRYGVLTDIAAKIMSKTPIDITTGYANIIWQGDACNQTLLSLKCASSPPTPLNITGPETISIRNVAEKLGKLLDIKPIFTGQENMKGYLSDSSLANSLFGYPKVPLDKIIQWTAYWQQNDGQLLNKPTHFETQDGKY